MFKKGVLVLLVLSTTLMLIGWGKGKSGYGEAIPNNIKVVKLEKILQNPKEYKDKEVILEGNYGNYCCASDFVYKEGLEAIEVYPKGFPTPKLDRGTPIRVYGIVRSVEKAVEPKEKSKEQEEHHEVYIEAKGAETR